MRIDAQIPSVGIEDLDGRSVSEETNFQGTSGSRQAVDRSGSEEPEAVRQWNQTRADYPRDKTIHALFEEQAARTPGAIAIAFEDEQLTYCELNERADRLAAKLRKQGVGADTLVGICVPRSIEMMVGLLGILKAGAAYVPLDPSYPNERRQFMISDANIKVLLTRDGNADCGLRIVEEEKAEIRTSHFALPTSQAEGLAYVIYTSGSTGQPKGVMVRHRNVVNFFAGMDRVIGTPPGVWLAVTSISFDISVLELFWTLARGFKVVIQSEEWNAGHSIADNIARHGVTHFQCTPSQAALLIEDAPSLDALKEVRKLFLGGEALQAALLQRLSGHGEIYNMYGPTETTIWSAAKKISGADVAIGRPIANTQIHIVDEQLQPVPIGESGELLIGGDGVAAGYLNRPELTADKFMPDFFGADPAARLYRTGDLARWRDDGSIEFLGRLDNQIKLRGHRIELGEIEAVLMLHPLVQRAIVSVREDQPGDQRLAAYIVPHADAGSPETLAQWQTIWDGAYARREVAEDPTFNISGWRSSYTGEAIPAEEMREWVRDTVDKILAIQPKSVLEIGCGTGLLLFQLAPHCERYCGTDFSAAAIDGLKSVLAGRESACAVTLLQQRADEAVNIPEQAFDVVVLNSVIQYFPNAAYFLRVLQNALRAVKPGGTIFLGDVRNLALLDEFYASLELNHSDGNESVAELRQRIARRRDREKELVFAPEFFRGLRNGFPPISSVEFLLKSGAYQNEMTRFRYDVVMRMGEHVGDVGMEPITVPKELRAFTNCPSAQVATGQLPRELREHLKQQLPDFMVPAAFVLMPELPLTPNGKVDRKALPRPVAAAAAEQRSPGGSDLENAIAEIWRDVLQAEQVGLNENFFDLGGHSLLLAQVHLRLREALGIDVPLLQLFQYPTVHSLAEALGGKLEQKNLFGDVQQRAMRQRRVLGASNFRFRDHAHCLTTNGTSHVARA